MSYAGQRPYHDTRIYGHLQSARSHLSPCRCTPESRSSQLNANMERICSKIERRHGLHAVLGYPSSRAETRSRDQIWDSDESCHESKREAAVVDPAMKLDESGTLPHLQFLPVLTLWPSNKGVFRNTRATTGSISAGMYEPIFRCYAFGRLIPSISISDVSFGEAASCAADIWTV